MVRDQRQNELIQSFVDKGIIKASVRLGKTRIGVKLLQQLNPHSTILICYPDINIKDSWLNEMTLLNYSNPNITFTTFKSMHNYRDKIFDFIIIDEIHLLSEFQRDVLRDLLLNNKKLLGLTGTLNIENKLNFKLLGLNVIAEYTKEQAIEENIIKDYNISIHTVTLDNKTILQFGKKRRTEKQQFNAYTYIIDSLAAQGKDTFYLRLNRMRLLMNSIAKIEKTKELINSTNEKVLIFCGNTKVCDSLQIASHHSKKSSDKEFKKFLNGEIDKLAVCKIGGAGITYPKLNRVIINYVDSNSNNLEQKIGRCLNMEFGQIAQIDIIVSNEEIELAWLKKALVTFDKNKIIWV